MSWYQHGRRERQSDEAKAGTPNLSVMMKTERRQKAVLKRREDALSDVSLKTTTFLTRSELLALHLLMADLCGEPQQRQGTCQLYLNRLIVQHQRFFVCALQKQVQIVRCYFVRVVAAVLQAVLQDGGLHC